MAKRKTLIISPRKSDRGLYVYQARVHERTARSPRGFMRYENEDGRNKSDVGGSSESFLKAPRVTRQVYAETSIILVAYFIASWANSGSPVLRPAASLFSFLPPSLPWLTACLLASLPPSRPVSPSDGLARSRPRSDPPTFLFLIDSSSAFYTSSFSPSWLFPFAKSTILCEKYSPQCSRFNIPALHQPRVELSSTTGRIFSLMSRIT